LLDIFLQFMQMLKYFLGHGSNRSNLRRLKIFTRSINLPHYGSQVSKDINLELER
jgi:hypothetical protein